MIVHPAWFWKAFTGMAVISEVAGTYKGQVWRGGQWGLGGDHLHPEAPLASAICQTSHHNRRQKVMGVGGDYRDPVRKKTPRGTLSHMPNKSTHQCKTITEDEANI